MHSMASLQFLFCVLLPYSVLGYRFFDSEELKPCPNVIPDTSVQFEKLSGRWQVSLLILDSATEDIEESGECITGEVTPVNGTHLRQIWEMFTPFVENEPTATFELMTTSLQPGVWAVHTPLGGTLSAVVFDSSAEHLLVTHCGWSRGAKVHLWTAAVTRRRLTPRKRMRISQALIAAGFPPSETKVITWSNC